MINFVVIIINLLLNLKLSFMERKNYFQPTTKVLSMAVHGDVCEEIVATSFEPVGPYEPKANASGVIFEN